MALLPEVEVLRRDLERDVVGKRVKDVSVRTPALVVGHRSRADFVKALTGAKFRGVGRRGIRLLLEVERGEGKAADRAVLIVRLGALGRLSRETASQAPGRHTQLVATFTTGGSLHYVDPGKDAAFSVVAAADVDAVLDSNADGVDPLVDTVAWPALGARLAERATPLKALLSDDTFIVGLGDVYADEVLWAAGLAAGRGSEALSSQEVRRLHRGLLEVLHDAVKHGGAPRPAGAPARDADDDEGAEPGGVLRVVGREGLPCARCRQPIQRDDVDGRPWYHCPQCQG